MRILHYVTSFSILSETFIYDYITELESQGADNYVVTENRMNTGDRPFGKVEEVKQPGTWHPERLLRRVKTAIKREEPRLANWAILRRRLAKAIEEINPDVIHAHFGPVGVKIAPVARKLNTPLIVSYYGYDISRLIRNEFWTQRYQNVFSTATKVVGISNHICSKLKNIGASEEQVQLLHLGVRMDNFAFPDREAGNKDVVQCLHVGRLVGKKSPLDLVRAFNYANTLAESGIDLRLKIVGDGPLLDDLVAEVEKLKLTDKIEVLGALPHSQIPELMKEADIYTQHCKTAPDGDQEGQGVSFVEASAMGLPIVSTNHNGLPDVIINDETGFLVEEGDYEAMGKKILYLAQNPEIRTAFGRNGRKHIEEHFDLTKQAAKAQKMYADILNK